MWSINIYMVGHKPSSHCRKINMAVKVLLRTLSEARAVRCVGILENAVRITVTPPGYLIRDAARKQVRNLRLRDSHRARMLERYVFMA